MPWGVAGRVRAGRILWRMSESESFRPPNQMLATLLPFGIAVLAGSVDSPGLIVEEKAVVLYWHRSTTEFATRLKTPATEVVGRGRSAATV